MWMNQRITIKLVASLCAAWLLVGSVAVAVFGQEGENAFLPIVAAEGQADDPPDDAGGEGDYEANRQYAIELVTAETEVADFLATLGAWTADAYPEDDSWVVWHVNLFENGENWTGYGTANLVTGVVIEYFVPATLPPDEYQAGVAALEFFIAHDAEIAARLGTPELWEHYIDFDVWEQAWFVWFEYGLDNWLGQFYVDGDDVYLEEFYDPEVFEAEEQAELNRNRAIEIAWRAEAIDRALNGVDNWVTYVERQGDAMYSVAFVDDDVEYFYALVDIDTETILETAP